MLQTDSHLIYSFGHRPHTPNHSSGIVFFMRKTRFCASKVISCDMPTDPILQGRAALLRYRNGTEDLAFAGMYFPPKPASHVKPQCWKVAKGIVDWMQDQIAKLPQRCTLFTFGDINDDFGRIRHNGSSNFSEVTTSASLGTARLGDEKFISTRFRHMCERNMQAIASTFWKTGPTYQGHDKSSYVDTWTIPMSQMHAVREYKVLPRLAAKFIGITSKIKDHVPVYLLFEHELVKTRSDFFRWDRDGMVKSMNNLYCKKRIAFIHGVEEELATSQNKERWRNLWGETTVDPMWETINDIVSKHAKQQWRDEAHRNEFYVALDTEHTQLMDERSSLLGEIYDLGQKMSSSCFSSESHAAQSHPIQSEQTEHTHAVEMDNRQAESDVCIVRVPAVCYAPVPHTFSCLPQRFVHIAQHNASHITHNSHIQNFVNAEFQAVHTSPVIGESSSPTTHSRFVQDGPHDEDENFNLQNFSMEFLHVEQQATQHFFHRPPYSMTSRHNALCEAEVRLKKRIQGITDNLKALRKKHRETIDTHLSSEIDLACKQNDYAKAWRLSRTLSSNFIGAKKRKYGVLRCSRPTVSQWSTLLSQDGSTGGMQATIEDFETVQRDRNMQPPFFFPVTKQIRELAKDDMKGLVHSLTLSKKRKAIPGWSVPGEAWWLLFVRIGFPISV